MRQLGTQAGRAYAGRISPQWRWESRTWFAKGSPELKLAKRHVRAGDWEGAADIWRSALETGNPRVAGKAKFNLALYNERKGNLRVALKRAREGAVAISKPRTRSYVAILERRLRDQERLEGGSWPRPRRVAARRKKRRPARPLPPRARAARAPRAPAAGPKSRSGSSSGSKPSSGGTSGGGKRR